MRITIFGKIIIGFSLLLVLVLFIGIYSLTTLNTSIQRYSTLLTRNKDLIDGVRTMQVDFKKQVQEWKNILIRGHNLDDLEKYTNAFSKKYEEIQEQGAELQTLVTMSENKALLQQFLDEHQKLQEQYVAALNTFRLAGGSTYKETDTFVRGIDRLPTDLLDTLVENIIAETDKNRARIDQQADVAKNVSLGVLILTFVVAVVISFVTARMLSKPIVEIAGTLREVAKGNVGITVRLTTKKDEIGDLARSTETMVAYLKEVSEVAEKVSNKDLHVEVTPKSEQDVLNHSLLKMVTNLHKMMDENEKAMAEIEQQNASMKQQNWLKDGVSQLSTQLSGENSVKDVCQKAINFAARHVNAGRGVLYTYNADQKILTLQGAFAFTERDHLSNTYKLGEGIIGQVAMERTPILLKNLSREESEIKTGLTSEAPLNTYTFPLMYEGNLYGVLELASFEPFETIQQEFLDEANRVIATALFSTEQKERVQKLLHTSEHAAEEAERAKAEAQQQAEEVRQANVLLEEKQQELEQQNEEFQQMNAQLKEQQHQLEQQREELRQQRENLKQAQVELERRTKKLEV